MTTVTLDTLHPRCREATDKLMVLGAAQGLDLQVHCTTRSTVDQIAIYGRERWTMHYVGLAVDIYPVLRVDAHHWQAAFNAWPHWNLLQRVLAVQAGFDAPQAWQLNGDRPHLQMTCGLKEADIKAAWYDTHGNQSVIWVMVAMHGKEAMA